LCWGLPQNLQKRLPPYPQAPPQTHQSPRVLMHQREEAIRQKNLTNFLSQPRSAIDNSLPKRRRAYTHRASTARPSYRVPRRTATAIAHQPQAYQQQRPAAEWATMSNTWLPTSFAPVGQQHPGFNTTFPPSLQYQNSAGVHSSEPPVNEILMLSRKLQPLPKSINQSVYGPYLSRDTDDAFGLMYRAPTTHSFTGATMVSRVVDRVPPTSTMAPTAVAPAMRLQAQ